MVSHSYSVAHRPDVDGLRALAVLSLILFHAGVAGFAGGFVGIDVFFVISGYLLTGPVLSGLYQRRFSFPDFYARRARRFIPALAAVIGFSLIASFYLLMPDAFADAGVAAQRAAYFVVNHHFAGLENDYWAQVAVGTQPLLQTWSLAVGAQFAVLLPCLMVLLFRIGRRSDSLDGQTYMPPPVWVVRGVLLGLALISYAVGSALLETDPAAAFYLLSARAWEFLLGALIATLANSRAGRPPLWFAEICSIIGLVCVLWGVLTFTEATPFPGAHALVPTVGAALLLYAGPSTWVAKILSLRPLVLIGAMSYSLFLWHWPLLVLFGSTVWAVKGFPAIPVWAYLLITFAVSWVSWRVIERPFRAEFLASRPLSVLGAALILIMAPVIGGMYAVQVGRSDQQSLPPILMQLDRDTSVPPGSVCEGKSDLAVIRAGESGCELGDPATLPPNAVPDFILLGDSHARMWVRAFDTASRELDIHGVAMAYADCVPLRGALPAARKDCVHITEAALDYVARSPIPQVILAGDWITAMESGFTHAPVNRDATAQSAFSDALRDTIRYLQQAGKAVTVLMDVPHLENDDVPRDSALKSISQQGADVFGPSRSAHLARQEPVMKSLEVVWPQVKPFGIVDPTVDLCGTGHCLVAREGRTWYGNKHQLTDAAADELRSVFLPLLRSVSAPR